MKPAAIHDHPLFPAGWRHALALLVALAAGCDSPSRSIAADPPEGAEDRGVLADGQTELVGQEGRPTPATVSAGSSGGTPSASASSLPGAVSSMGSSATGPSSGATSGSTSGDPAR